jgi:hypothetical protein
MIEINKYAARVDIKRSVKGVSSSSCRKGYKQL